MIIDISARSILLKILLLQMHLNSLMNVNEIQVLQH